VSTEQPGERHLGPVSQDITSVTFLGGFYIDIKEDGFAENTVVATLPAVGFFTTTPAADPNYLFHSPLNYEKNYVNIVAPNGVAVTLDGAPVGGFVAIGGTGYSVARPLLPNNVDGNHTITAPEPISISVYGYGQYTSYWYPGGLDLNLIPQ
jgi:hypothetical protein